MISPHLDKGERESSWLTPFLLLLNWKSPLWRLNPLSTTGSANSNECLCWNVNYAAYGTLSGGASTRPVPGSTTADSMTRAHSLYTTNMSTFSWLRRTEKTPSITSCCSERKRRQARRDCSNSPSLCERRNLKQIKRLKRPERILKIN